MERLVAVASIIFSPFSDQMLQGVESQSLRHCSPSHPASAHRLRKGRSLGGRGSLEPRPGKSFILAARKIGTISRTAVLLPKTAPPEVFLVYAVLEINTTSLQPQGKSSASAASSAGKSKDQTQVAVDKAWAEYVPPVNSTAEHYRHSRLPNGHRQPSRQRKDRNDFDSEEIAVASCAETDNHFVNFLGPPEIRKFFQPEFPGEERQEDCRSMDLSGLYARDNGRVREFAPKTEGDLDAFETWVNSIDPGEVVLIAGIKLSEAVMQKVLSCLERLGAMRRQVPEGCGRSASTPSVLQLAFSVRATAEADLSVARQWTQTSVRSGLSYSLCFPSFDTAKDTLPCQLGPCL
eukprot:s1780_g4.t1